MATTYNDLAIELDTDQALEKVWCEWLLALPASDFHFILKAGIEMDWHDQLVAGTYGWQDIEDALDALHPAEVEAE